MYYLTYPGDISGGGVFEGTVEKIGWNNDWILARVTRLSHGDTNGWYALDLKTKRIIGPIPEADLKTNASLSKIDCHECVEVFANRK